MEKLCLVAILALTGAILGIVAMFLNYKAKFERKGVILEKNDREHQHKHHQNEQRIKELEKKNGAEQRQINELNAQIEILKKVIYERDRKQNQQGKYKGFKR